MKKVLIWTISVAIVLAVLAFVYFTRGTFTTEPTTPTVAPTPVATATATPTATPAPTTTPTAQPTPTVKAMTAEEFFKELHRSGSPEFQGTTIIISGIVSDKEGEELQFLLPYNDPVRGEREFWFFVWMKNKGDLPRVKIGDTVTIKARVVSYRYNISVRMAEGELIK